MMIRRLMLLSIAAVCFAAYEYKGGNPPKPDLPYLVHADNLIPTDAGEAKKESAKKSTTFYIEGAAASAKTPLPEPIFLIDAHSLDITHLNIFPFKVVNGRREFTINSKGAAPLKKSVHRVRDNLYVFEAAEALPAGQYALSPDGSDVVFCFEVF